MSARSPQELAAAEVERALAEVLARAEFEEPGGAGEGIFERIADWLSGLSGRLGLPPELADALATTAVAILVALVALAALLLIARSVRSRARAAGDRPGEDPEARRARVRELLERAAGARAAGELRLALRLTLWALVVGLSEQRELEYRDAWTNRELLERGRPSPAVAAELGPLQDELDRKLFGGGEVGDADLERLEGLCRRWLGAAPADAGGAGA
jgi:hypothetical protein